MGKGRNKKRANNRAQRVHERSVRDYEHERNTQPPEQWLITSDDQHPAMIDRGARRLNDSSPVRPVASARRHGFNSNQLPTLIPTPNIDEIFGQVLDIILEELESYISTMRAHNTTDNQRITSYDIENLPTREITTEDQGEDDGEATCHVCQESVQTGTVVTWLPKCQHWFCAECLEPWLRDHNTCPTCREVIE
ncbi:E3 ubiquitin-protein ligase [Pseudocercospora fuligena]|uniref:E3 ubiquitin-protein ligase n=1 Tax=Pseudocercospora fuligena TaxID=685502 RepID=A0A8H6RK20_9PEZI|nr:E3 ubiquitin-protein ligase [Pseudocercospora fuligena]